MPDNAIPIHYVGTIEEAEQLCRQHGEFWVSNCGCREGNKKGCARSRADVCLMFSGGQGASGSGKREISRQDVAAILEEARSKELVARPFRSDDRTITDGICFCCDDCCGYFLDPAEVCDKGKQVEQTDMGKCTHCGACAGACHFGARTMELGALTVDRDQCYGCGLCVDMCPVNCIEMKKRTA
ncbi:MAG: 4Fe-4S binding protein [Candidatus Edwardsbacteria bacterium]|jgi:Pyruvate/2-oxoacid:ferredoxin oxidoreductase delta subunit|nr:4Fe-4S binding protein [Candidatus Edwardsbacteria bacterium]